MASASGYLSINKYFLLERVKIANLQSLLGGN